MTGAQDQDAAPGGGGDGRSGDAAVDAQTRADTAVVLIEALQESDSPRLNGVSPEHVYLLLEAGADFPPIVVHRPTMRVIDGMHRLYAMRLRGQQAAEVQFFDGDDHAAFVMAVKANISHGLPLTGADRKAAAIRILTERPLTSDRSVAADTGLAPRTVAALRHELGDEAARATVRIGRDGRERPIDSTNARRIAGEVVASRPDASLREIARIAGISLATARDVRERMRHGEDPVPGSAKDRPDGLRGAAGAARSGSGRRPRPPDRDMTSLLESLSKDPSLRFSESGRALLRWIFVRASGLEEWNQFVNAVPPHSSFLLADLAARCADQWTEFAARLKEEAEAA